MIYFYLAVAIVAEVIGTIVLPLTKNFTRPAPSLVVAICYGTAFFMLSVIVEERFRSRSSTPCGPVPVFA